MEIFEEMGRNPLKELLLFMGLTFGLTWGLSTLWFLVPSIGQIVGGPPGSDEFHNWLFYVAVYAPSISAIVLLVWHEGIAGLRRALGKAFAPGKAGAWVVWLVAAAFMLPAIWLLLAAVGNALDLDWMGGADATILLVVVPATLVTTGYLLPDPGPIGEEFGWRGYAMPRLLALTSPTAAGAILGLIWAIWHLPAFVIDASSQSGLNISIFFVSLTAQGVWMTWLYLRTSGNWFIAGFVPHAIINCSAALGGFDERMWIYAIGPVILALITLFDPVMRLGKSGAARRNAQTTRAGLDVNCSLTPE